MKSTEAKCTPCLQGLMPKTISRPLRKDFEILWNQGETITQYNIFNLVVLALAAAAQAGLQEPGGASG